MITVLITMVIGAFIGVIQTDGWNKILGFFLGLFVGIMVGVIIASLIGGIGHRVFPDKITEEVSNTRYLEVVQDNSTISGSFFLGCGSINGEMFYSFYEQVNKDEFKLDKIRYDNATIKIIRDGSKPRIEIIHKKWQTNWGIWNNYRNVIYVPNGTIKNVYNLDAK